MREHADLKKLMTNSTHTLKQANNQITGEEVDIDLSHSDQDSPVIWLRVDPEMLWLSKTSIEMPDYMWQAMLLHERDVVYQHIAAEVSLKPKLPWQLRFGSRG